MRDSLNAKNRSCWVSWFTIILLQGRAFQNAEYILAGFRIFRLLASLNDARQTPWGVQMTLIAAATAATITIITHRAIAVKSSSARAKHRRIRS